MELNVTARQKYAEQTVNKRLEFSSPEYLEEYHEFTFSGMTQRIKILGSTAIIAEFIIMAALFPLPNLEKLWWLGNVWAIVSVLIVLVATFLRVRPQYLYVCGSIFCFSITLRDSATQWMVAYVYGAPSEFAYQLSASALIYTCAILALIRPPLRNSFPAVWAGMVGNLIIDFSGFMIFVRPLDLKWPLIRGILLIANVTSATLAGMYVEYYARREFLEMRSIHDSKINVKVEGNKRLDLLQAIMPSAVASELAAHPDVTIAEHFDNATIVFVALVGLQRSIEQIDGGLSRLLVLLNQIFSRWDAIAERWGVEKIKTIEDTYMAAAGIPQRVPDHAARVARFACEVAQGMSALRHDLKINVEVKIGMQCGPVVAGVIGTSKSLWDCWGDTVNTASRMKMYAHVGTICMTKDVADQISGQFRFHKSSSTEVKGKGMMDIYTLDTPLHEISGLGPANFSPVKTLSMRNDEERLKKWNELTGERMSRWTLYFQTKNDQVTSLTDVASNTMERDFRKAAAAWFAMYDTATVPFLVGVAIFFALSDLVFLPEELVAGAMLMRFGLMVVPFACFSGAAYYMRPNMRGLYLVAIMFLYTGHAVYRVWLRAHIPAEAFEAFLQALMVQTLFICLINFFLLHTLYTAKLTMALVILVMDAVAEQLALGVAAGEGAAGGTAGALWIILIAIYMAVSSIAARMLERGMRKTFLLKLIGQREMQALQEAEDQTDALLRNILPEHVIPRVLSRKHDSDVVSDVHEEISFLASDLVGFTKLSAQMTPESLVELLNGVFRGFDILVRKYQLEKIKTIGDAYLVAGNCPVKKKDHAQRMASLALDMINFLKHAYPNLEVRIGIDIGGPVVSGVIGAKKFAYDVWGNTVVMAQEFEQTSKAGLVHVSPHAKDVIGPGYIFEASQHTSLDSFILRGRDTGQQLNSLTVDTVPPLEKFAS